MKTPKGVLSVLCAAMILHPERHTAHSVFAGTPVVVGSSAEMRNVTTTASATTIRAAK
jgi:hypothetical protein